MNRNRCSGPGNVAIGLCKAILIDNSHLITTSQMYRKFYQNALLRALGFRPYASFASVFYSTRAFSPADKPTPDHIGSVYLGIAIFSILLFSSYQGYAQGVVKGVVKDQQEPQP